MKNSAMKSPEFLQFIQVSKDFVKSKKIRGDKLEQSYAFNYTDGFKKYFYELIQNAHDSGASHINIQLQRDGLVFEHNGQPFNLEQIESLCTVHVSNKSTGDKKIGKFGVGFMSILNFTSTPEIHSGEWHFRVTDYGLVPEPIEDDVYLDKTRFTLPFDYTEDNLPNDHCFSKQIAFSKAGEALKDIGNAFLFLNEITRVQYSILGEKSFIAVKEAPLSKKVKVPRKVNVTRKTISTDNQVSDYLMFMSFSPDNHKTPKAAIAFKVSDNNSTIQLKKETNPFAYVFFPTRIKSGTSFVVHGDFAVESDRERIDFKRKRNSALIKEIGRLVTNSLPVLKNLKALDEKALDLFVFEKTENDDDYPIRQEVKVATIEKFDSGEVLVPVQGKYCSIKDLLLIGYNDNDLEKLLTARQRDELLDRQYALKARLLSDKVQKFFSDDLRVAEIDSRRFGIALSESPDFLEKQEASWFVKFYKYLLKHPDLWKAGSRSHTEGLLRNQPIIYLKDDTCACPFDQGGHLQVFFADGRADNNYKYIHPEIENNNDAKEFLKELGVTPPNIESIITNQILPGYQSENPPIISKEYLQDFGTVLKWYKRKQDTGIEENNAILDGLINSCFVLSSSLTGKSIACRRGRDVYFASDDLKKFFEGNDEVYFINPQLVEEFGEEGIKLLQSLGVNSTLRKKEDFSIEGVKEYIDKQKDSWDIDSSVLLWRLLIAGLQTRTPNDQNAYLRMELTKEVQKALKNLTGIKGIDKRKMREIYDSYTYPSGILELKESEWLFDTNGNKLSPNQLSLSNLSEHYNIDLNANYLFILEECLGFRPENQQLTEDERKFLSFPRDKQKRIIEELEQQERKKNEKNQSDPGPIEVIDPATLTIIPKKKLTDMSVRPGRKEKDKPGKANPYSPIQRDSKKRKSTDRRGMALVMAYERMRNRIPEDVSDQYLTDEGSAGCDILSYDFEHKIKRWIEVKTTISGENVIVLTRDGFKKAKEENKNYYLYHVTILSDAKAEIRVIQDPLKILSPIPREYDCEIEDDDGEVFVVTQSPDGELV